MNVHLDFIIYLVKIFAWSAINFVENVLHLLITALNAKMDLFFRIISVSCTNAITVSIKQKMAPAFLVHLDVVVALDLILTSVYRVILLISSSNIDALFNAHLVHF